MPVANTMPLGFRVRNQNAMEEPTYRTHVSCLMAAGVSFFCGYRLSVTEYASTVRKYLAYRINSV